MNRISCSQKCNEKNLRVLGEDKHAIGFTKIRTKKCKNQIFLFRKCCIIKGFRQIYIPYIYPKKKLENVDLMISTISKF
jgi:hypothetical protein